MATNVKYPDIKVKLGGMDGNAFAILAKVTRSMQRALVSQIEIDSFKTEAMSGDYDHLLQTCMKWVDVT